MCESRKAVTLGYFLTPEKQCHPPAVRQDLQPDFRRERTKDRDDTWVGFVLVMLERIMTSIVALRISSDQSRGTAWSTGALVYQQSWFWTPLSLWFVSDK